MGVAFGVLQAVGEARCSGNCSMPGHATAAVPAPCSRGVLQPDTSPPALHHRPRQRSQVLLARSNQHARTCVVAEPGVGLTEVVKHLDATVTAPALQERTNKHTHAHARTESAIER